ncbi:MAG: DUF3843 family protein [Bacteroidota bacterium]
MKRRKARRNRNNKSKYSTIFITDWLKLKPYQKRTEYDELYTKIANEIYDIITPLVEIFTEKSDQQSIKTIALNISQYFEDIISEIGIWKAFTDMNQDYYGYILPFYELNDYVQGDINSEDIQFLIWHYFSVVNEATYSPNIPEFENYAIKIFNHLNEYEEVLLSDYHKDFYKVRPTDNYFDVRKKITSVTKTNYLINLEANIYLKKQKIATSEVAENPVQAEYLFYMTQEKAVLKHHYQLNALTGLELFARLANCTEATRTRIRDLGKRCTGEFIYRESTSQFYRFEHRYTKRSFKVWRASMQPSIEQLQEGAVSVMELTFWDEKWWLSGAMIGRMQGDEMPRKAWSEAIYSFYSNTEEQQEKLKENEAQGHEAFIETFGSNVYFANSPKQVVDAYERYYRNLLQKAQRTAEKILSESDIEETVANTRQMIKAQVEDFSRGAAIAYIENEGLTLQPNYQMAAEYLDRPQLNPQEIDELYDFLFLEFPSELTQHFIDRYPTDNLKLPMQPSNLDVVKYWKFLHRYHLPENYAPKTPNVKFVDTSEEL